MTDFYDVALKETNLAALTAWDSFSLNRVDLTGAPLRHLLDGAEVVFHLDGQPGVRPLLGIGIRRLCPAERHGHPAPARGAA
jgi:hypothetical protein